MYLLGLALALSIGLSLGMMGGGGSILTVPIFVYVLGYDAKQAIAMSLAVVGTTSLIGAIGHWRAGNVNLRIALIFGSVAMLGAFLGARLSVYFSGAAQLVLFAGVMLVAAYFMFRGRRSGSDQRSDSRHAEPVGGMPVILIAVEGIAVGVLTGLIGVGGGFLIVPALVLLGRVPMKEAVGTSLLVIALNSASGFYGHLGRVEVEWAFMALFTAIAICGILVGAAVVRFIPQEALRKAFAVFLVIMGVFILYQNRGAILSVDDGAAGSTAARPREALRP